MSRLAKLSARFIGEGGFSIGITDVTPSAALMADKGSVIRTAYKECDQLISDFKGGTLSLLPGCDEDQSLEVHTRAACHRSRTPTCASSLTAHPFCRPASGCSSCTCLMDAGGVSVGSLGTSTMMRVLQ